MSDITEAYIGALTGMGTQPKRLHQIAQAYAQPDPLDPDELLQHLMTASPEDPLRIRLHHAMAGWDREPSSEAWTNGTSSNSDDRRARLIQQLGLDQETADQINILFPIARTSRPIVIADKWTPWRTPKRRSERDFYWTHYRDHLSGRKGWSAPAIAGLDQDTEEVVSRLADPTSAEAYQAKGLVVGYVQSGKTANFTGVVAKAIDAGYRLVIVLTGTTNMLRAQTQRRLDMELAGRENLEEEISTKDQHEYQDDPDWIEDRFIRHGGRPSDLKHPDIIRLSTHGDDYQPLKQGYSALDFKKREVDAHLFEPVNLFNSDARLVVAKKNGTVLTSLVADLGRLKDRLGEVPVLIIDDESDQASVNTTSPKKWQKDRKKRTAINRLIGELLRQMPRAQYVGYTATPYANIFIDPDDNEDIFPRDFIIALERPVGYMGAEDFLDRDQDVPVAERPFDSSNERAHLRVLGHEPSDDELRTALDMFVLTGAMKAYRQRVAGMTFRHHTMLVHEAMGRDTHREAAETIKKLWKDPGYRSPQGRARLRQLYLSDILPVSEARSTGPTPQSFEDLEPDIDTALTRMQPADDASPVLIINSDKYLEQQQESLDFDKRDIWRILVGGNKLARGFTVEGLTVTYYRRTTVAMDTLLQMGRWFGFRPNYRDLVRVFTTTDLHDMFTAACLDEEYLRGELRAFSDGGGASESERLTPAQVPPFIGQHRSDLRPTARIKMWNARMVHKSIYRSVEPVAYGTTPAQFVSNASTWVELLSQVTSSAIFPVNAVGSTEYQANYAEIGHQELMVTLGKLQWITPDTFQPELRWLKQLSPADLNRWVVYVPAQTRDSSRRTLVLAGAAAQSPVGPFSVYARKRASPLGALRVASEERHRYAARCIAGTDVAPAGPRGDLLRTLAQPATGALIIYPTIDRARDEAIPGVPGGPINPADLTTAFHMVVPGTFMINPPAKLILWETVNSADRQAIAVTREPHR